VVDTVVVHAFIRAVLCAFPVLSSTQERQPGDGIRKSRGALAHALADKNRGHILGEIPIEKQKQPYSPVQHSNP
jgi:hypothetical protein